MKENVRLYHKGSQLSRHLLTGRIIKHLYLKNVYLILNKYENKCKVIEKGIAVELPPTNR